VRGEIVTMLLQCIYFEWYNDDDDDDDYDDDDDEIEWVPMLCVSVEIELAAV